MKHNTTIKECLEAATKLVEVIDNADHSDWHWKRLEEAMKKAESTQAILENIIKDDGLARVEEAYENSLAD